MTEVDLESLKGFYDRYPSEWSSWKKLIEVVDETAEEFGFRQIDTPNLEKADLYRVKSGDELMDQMYNFKDKGDREISLIPEQTPTRARLVQKRKDLKTPIKWYDTSKRWRYENVQKGRDREFFQGDFDIFGIESVEADAEVIAAAARIYEKLDLEDRVKFKLNDRRLLEAFLEVQGDVQNLEEVMHVIDDKEKMSQDEFQEELSEAMEDPDKSRIDAIDALTDNRGSIRDVTQQIRENYGDDESFEDVREEVERMESLADALEAYGVLELCELDMSIVRGLAYYTGLVFEAFDAEGELRALFGGGRYDELVGMFGNQEVPAVGFAFGYSTTVELLRKEDRWPLNQVETDVYVLSVSESVRDTALRYATSLREKGLSVETDLSGRGFGEQLEYADSINANRTLIVGERDLENDQVTIKHMDSGDEEEVGKNEVVEHLENEDFF